MTSSTRRTTLRLASRRLALPRFSHGRKRRSQNTGGSTEQMLTVSCADGCGQLMDDGGDATLLIHKDTELEAAIAEDGTVSDAENTTNPEFTRLLQLVMDSSPWKLPSGREWHIAAGDSVRRPPQVSEGDLVRLGDVFFSSTRPLLGKRYSPRRDER